MKTYLYRASNLKSTITFLAFASPYAGGVQVGSPEPPFKINDIHSMHVVDLLACC